MSETQGMDGPRPQPVATPPLWPRPPLRPAPPPPGATASARPSSAARAKFIESLADAHTAARSGVRQLFGAARTAPDQRLLVSVVPRNEALFLASYLDIPARNLLCIEALPINPQPVDAASPRWRARAEQVQRFLRERPVDGCALTFVGHMSPGDGQGLFGDMPPQSLHALFRATRPLQVNLFSCVSERYSEALGRQFELGGHAVAHRTAFVTDVSPYPPVERRGKPLRFFYTGQELGPGLPELLPAQHGPLLHGLVTAAHGDVARRTGGG